MLTVKVNMDPNATLARIDGFKSMHDPECQEAIMDLRAWIVRGGFEPDWAKYPKATFRYHKVLGIRTDED